MPLLWQNFTKIRLKQSRKLVLRRKLMQLGEREVCFDFSFCFLSPEIFRQIVATRESNWNVNKLSVLARRNASMATTKLAAKTWEVVKGIIHERSNFAKRTLCTSLNVPKVSHFISGNLGKIPDPSNSEKTRKKVKHHTFVFKQRKSTIFELKKPIFEPN